MTTVSGRAGRWRKKYKGKTYYRYGDREHADQAVDKLSELRRRFAASKLSPLNREDWFEANFDLPMDAEWIRELPKLVGLVPSADAQPSTEPSVPAHVAVALGLEPPAEPVVITPTQKQIDRLDGSPLRIACELWRDRLAVMKRKAAPEDESLQAHVQKYLKQKENQAKVGEVSSGRYYSLKLHLTHFQDWLGKDKLWPETFRLLKQERAANSTERVLLNVNGSPILSEVISKDGKYQKTDNVKNAFHRLLNALAGEEPKRKPGATKKPRRKAVKIDKPRREPIKIEKPLKSLKKTSASLLRDNERYTGLAGLFLGHSPQSMSDKHYTEVPQQLLDQTVLWLGNEYGLA